MYRTTLSAALLLLSLNVSAQVTSPLMTCGGAISGAPITVKFNGQTASVSFDGRTHTTTFDRAWLGDKGKRWSRYRNAELTLSTTFPLDKWIDIGTPIIQGKNEGIWFGNCN
jgi:hypothetical protein